MPELDYRTVANRTDLVEFIRNLNSVLQNNPNELENNTLEAFLGAASAWLDDIGSETDFQSMGISTAPSDWRFLALLIHAGLMYE